MAFKMKGSAFKLGNVATKSALKQASPMKRAGIYKTLEDGTMVQISKSEADKYGHDYEGDAVSMSYTGDDAIAFNKEDPVIDPNTGETVGATNRTKEMTEDLMASYPTHTAGKKKKLKGTGKSKYNPKGAVYELDNRIQAKINAGEPLTEAEKLHQAEALRHLSINKE